MVPGIREPLVKSLGVQFVVRVVYLHEIVLHFGGKVEVVIVVNYDIKTGLEWYQIFLLCLDSFFFMSDLLADLL